MQVISGVNNSAFFAQSAYSAATATFDKNGNDIAETYYPANNPSAFITGVDLTPYQTTASMTGYLTTADSANFYPATSNPSGYLTAVPDTYLQNTDLSTEDGKVTAISGIPLSAGGDVPEGVMTESVLEYNAVNEISGYNGSAIAQYGAEKQWLVHDDTLVHAANSAQYALGVNLSAVAQLLGVDETVLWSDTTNGLTSGSLVLNEPWSGFEKIRLDVVDKFGWGGSCMTFDTTNLAGARTKHFACTYSFIVAGSPNKTFNRGILLDFANNQYISGSSVGLETVFTPTSTIESKIVTGGAALIKVIGIGRKS